ncbi:hypothetical protein, partial [Sulfitobacter sp.]|uniref:hypothetical protein n=1 Tax=Sulfitobacter sp. TaxID=1903071 RepID=UPI00300295AD
MHERPVWGSRAVALEGWFNSRLGPFALLGNTYGKGGELTFAALGIDVRYARRSQLVDATHALKRSAGV